MPAPAPRLSSDPNPSPPTSTPFKAITTTTRKGLLNLQALIMVTIFAAALATAAFTGKLTWEHAFTLGTIALGVFGFHSGVTSAGIAAEDSARLKAQAPPSRIDASSSVTTVGTVDPDDTLDPAKSTSNPS